MPALHGHFDVPTPGETCDPLCFRLEGWVNAGARQIEVAAVEAWIDQQCVGLTSLQFERPDVSKALGLPAGTPSGFRMVGRLAAATFPDRSRLELRLRLHGETQATVVTSAEVRFTPRDYRETSFGILLRNETIGIMRREHMYTSGPSLPDGSLEVLGLLRQYLPAPPSRVLDVGCGLGYYGRALRPLGYDWLGAEVKAADCAALARQGLPCQALDGRVLPFAHNSFDAALCIEVLEHIDEPRAFLAEVCRVAPRRLLISVPNTEIIPYLNDYLVTPRHMLECDHKNFFTRWSLGSLLREFYPRTEVLLHTRHPLPATEGMPLFYNLFAIAWADDPSLG
ncbi:MAG: class I SAM-dependent methyltransferase [Opitutaceae bacterium]|nr:class I SAM-dependent methyltransferase [Opitutaceae bacterium]